jgi:hypothetical protein
MKLKNGTLLSFGDINSEKLTNECLMVQMLGVEYCHRCEAKNTRACGGKNIRKTGKNKAGYKVPLLER